MSPLLFVNVIFREFTRLETLVCFLETENGTNTLRAVLSWNADRCLDFVMYSLISGMDTRIPRFVAVEFPLSICRLTNAGQHSPLREKLNCATRRRSRTRLVRVSNYCAKLAPPPSAFLRPFKLNFLYASSLPSHK